MQLLIFPRNPSVAFHGLLPNEKLSSTLKVPLYELELLKLPLIYIDLVLPSYVTITLIQFPINPLIEVVISLPFKL